MAAPFVLDLLGFVGDKPNTADIANHGSTDIARGVLEVLGISHQASNAQTAGMNLEDGVKEYLAAELPRLDQRRPWEVRRGGAISEFRQYAHLARLNELVGADPTLKVELGQDYMISPDVTVGFMHGDVFQRPILHAAVSCKFSIRSDRVQNIRHEGVSMIRHRRGRQPHIVTVTSEPQPSRLAAICRGTGEVDAVYHVCLPELEEAVAGVGNELQQEALGEIVSQDRLYDLTELPDHLTV